MTAILGGLTPARFLRDYWQKRPLLIRQAFPGFAGIIDRDPFLRLATRADCRSRLIIHHPPTARRRRVRWERHDGPFGALDTSMLPARDWTVLVNGVESLVPGGWEILGAFSMIPSARVDDLMVSCAADGGTVGPHDDLYDVFLLQGPGRRRWQVSHQRDRRVDPDAAIKVLRAFVPEEEWLLEPGDMLYLPPGVAHHGVAEGACFTYSIGFLAPSHGELVESFLGYLGATLAARLDPDALYQDADLRLQQRPLEIGDAMVGQVAALLKDVRWSPSDVGDFLGRFLTRPKPRQIFTPPPRPITAEALARRLYARGTRRGRLALALPTRGLVRRGRLFLNGEAHTPGRPAARLFEQLVRQRSLALPLDARLDARTLDLLHGWYAAGYLTLS